MSKSRITDQSSDAAVHSQSVRYANEPQRLAFPDFPWAKTVAAFPITVLYSDIHLHTVQERVIPSPSTKDPWVVRKFTYKQAELFQECLERNSWNSCADDGRPHSSRCRNAGSVTAQSDESMDPPPVVVRHPWS